MTPKRLILISLAWTGLMFGVALAAIWYVAEHPISGVRAEDRASRLGLGLGALTGIGYAVLWLPYAAKVGKKRREERSRRQGR